MNMCNKTARYIVLLVTLCLPLQALASSLLPCLHTSEDVTAQVASHPCHLPTGEEQSGHSAADECHKCQLCQMLSVSALLLPQEMVEVSGRSVYTSHPVDHFYSFSPGGLQRPPSRLTPA